LVVISQFNFLLVISSIQKLIIADLGFQEAIVRQLASLVPVFFDKDFMLLFCFTFLIIIYYFR